MTANLNLARPADDSSQSHPKKRADILEDGDVQGAVNRTVAAARAMLVSKYGLDAAFVGVPMLARILGCSPTTIWSYIRHGKFFIPYRMIQGSPKVSVCDLAAWYCLTTETVSPRETGRWPPDAGGFDEPRADESKRERLVQRASEGDMVADVLASMGIERARGRRGGRAPR